MRGTTAVVGIGESQYDRPGDSPHTEFQLTCIAIQRAAEDAGIDVREIDGFVSYAADRNTPSRLATALGVDALRYGGLSWDGGGNGVAGAVAQADAALTAGYARYVVVYRGLAQGQFGRFGSARDRTGGSIGGEHAYMWPYGLMTAATLYAITTKRWMHDHGISHDALAEISLASYEHAQRNPRAVRYGRPITRDDYDRSRMIAAPFRLYDCCQENDGAAAAVMTTADQAARLDARPAFLRAAAQGMEHRGNAGGSSGSGYNDPDFPSAHFRVVADDLWERAGLGPEDVQVAQFYENFTGMVLIALCEMGFATPDTVEAWLTAGNLRWPDGALPTNTSGGNLAEAYIHGFQLVNEAVRQVRGDSTCQVADVRHSLVVSGPGALPSSAALFSVEP